MAVEPDNIPGEIWRDVLGYEGLYQVSSLGRVKALARAYWRVSSGMRQLIPVPERIRVKTLLKIGYYALGLTKDGRTKTEYVHKLVCEAFHGPRPQGCDVAHNDGCRQNNKVENLRWASRQENMADKLRHGTQPHGDALWFTKISDATVRRIRADQTKSNYRWAKELGVTHSTIGDIRKGKARKHALGSME